MKNKFAKLTTIFKLFSLIYSDSSFFKKFNYLTGVNTFYFRVFKGKFW